MSVGPWVQPDDVEGDDTTALWEMGAGSSQPPADAFAGVGAATVPTSGNLSANVTIPGGDGSIFCVFGQAIVTMPMPPVIPDLTDGATGYELEAEVGSLATGTYFVTAFDDGSTNRGTLYAGPDPAGAEPDGVGGWQPVWRNPSDLAGLDPGVIWVNSTGDGFEDFALDFTAGDMAGPELLVLTAWMGAHEAGSAPTVVSEAAYASVGVNYVYTPPRYRLLFPGDAPVWPLRQRQRTGDPWPIRSRQRHW